MEPTNAAALALAAFLAGLFWGRTDRGDVNVYLAFGPDDEDDDEQEEPTPAPRHRATPNPSRN
jgi:hypothetical protein